MPSNPQRENSPHPTVIRQCCMPSNPQRETYGSLIQQLYDNAACQVIHNGKLTEAFETFACLRNFPTTSARPRVLAARGRIRLRLTYSGESHTDQTHNDTLSPDNPFQRCRLAFHVSSKLGMPQVLDPSEAVSKIHTPHLLIMMAYLDMIRTLCCERPQDKNTNSSCSNDDGI
ncbi:unnamed protein product [Trichobilharzia regenti]|nr:unnamed protein product [Trichobilharzia regenti]